MPFSSNSGKNWIKQVLPILHTRVGINHVLDVGAGMGTYSSIIEKVNSNALINAIEVWEPYVEQYELNQLYDYVFRQDVREFDFTAQYYDLVIFGDILEHLTKTEAVRVVGEALENSQFVLLSIPIGYYPQGEYAGNPHEAHVTDNWSVREVLDTFQCVQAHHLDAEIGVFLLSRTDCDGLLDHVHEMMHDLNKLRIVCTSFYEKQHWHSLLWAAEEYFNTIDLYERCVTGFDHINGEIHCYLSLAQFYTGDLQSAYANAVIATEIEPENGILANNVTYFSQQLANAPANP